MNFAYLADNTVTGLNRAGQGEELTGQCTSIQRTQGMVAEYYTAPAGVLTPKSQNEIDALIRDQAEVNALARLATCYNQKITDGGFEFNGKDTKLTKALRKETKGNANAKDEKLLDDNDEVDDWYDQLELDMEGGETWLEDPARTTVELDEFDACLDITWTAPPVL